MKLITLMLGFALLLSAEGKYSNRRAPGFSIPDMTAAQYDTQDFRGKVLLIDIMITGCEHCQKLADNLKTVTAKYGNKVAVLSIVTMSADNVNTIRQFIKDHAIPWPVLFDSGQVIASYLKITPANPSVHFPHLFIIDQQGMIRADFEDGDDLSEANLAAQIGKYVK